MNNGLDKLRNFRLGEPALVIGNSPWRAGFPLRELDGFVTIGCNVIFREFAPEYLVAFDGEVIRTLLLEHAYVTSRVVLRAPEHRPGVLEVLRASADYGLADENVYALDGAGHGSEFNPGSLAGTLAIGLAGWLGCSSLTLVGFSLSDDNLYLGDRLYKSPSSTPEYSREPGARAGDFKPIREAVERYRIMASEANGCESSVHWVCPYAWAFERLRAEPAAAKWGAAR